MPVGNKVISITAEKIVANVNKMDNVEDGAQVNAIDAVNGMTGDVVLTQDNISNGSEYVRTHNDFTDAQKSKVDICATLDGNGTLTPSQIPASLKSGLRLIGSIDIDTQTTIDMTTNEIGDFYKMIGTTFGVDITVAYLNEFSNPENIVLTVDPENWIILEYGSPVVWDNTNNPATTTTQGEIILAGDLGGTANEPIVNTVNGKDPFALMTGATDISDGAEGIVPAPITGQEHLTLHGDGTWKFPYENIEVIGTKTDIKGTILTSPLPDVSPDDNDFDNSQVSFWVNESTDKVNIKAKKSDGSFLSQEVGSGSGGTATAEYIVAELSTETYTELGKITIGSTLVSSGMLVNPDSTITLIGGKTYEISASIGVYGDARGDVVIRDFTHDVDFGNNLYFMSASQTETTNQTPVATIIIKPTSDINVGLYIAYMSGTFNTQASKSFIKVVKIADPNSADSFQGATSSVDGTQGLVPAPILGQENNMLFGDGSWREANLNNFFTTDVTTGKKYKIVVDNGLLYLEEV